MIMLNAKELRRVSGEDAADEQSQRRISGTRAQRRSKECIFFAESIRFIGNETKCMKPTSMKNQNEHLLTKVVHQEGLQESQ